MAKSLTKAPLLMLWTLMISLMMCHGHQRQILLVDSVSQHNEAANVSVLSVCLGGLFLLYSA